MSTPDTPEMALLSELEEFQITPELRRTLSELFYTADETGIVEFSIKPPENEMIYRICMLALKYARSGESIEHLRM